MECHIRSSGVDARRAATSVLKHVFKINFGSTPQFTCAKHQVVSQTYANNVVTNIYWNNKRNIISTDVVKSSVGDFKRPKCTKVGSEK